MDVKILQNHFVPAGFIYCEFEFDADKQKRLSPWLKQQERICTWWDFKNKRNVEEDVWSLLGGKRHHAHSRLAGFSKKLFVHELTAVISYSASQSSFVIMGFCIIFRSKAQRLLQCTAQFFFFYVYHWFKNNDQQLMRLLVQFQSCCVIRLHR